MEIKYESKYYPEKLRNIKNPPQKIYVLGNADILNNFGIAIIGSRSCSTYGEKMTKFFAKNLNKYNINIISGMAIGIDKYAHLETIKENGVTIAVLPSGFNKIYPKENKFLVDKIIDSGGAVISEYDREVTATSKSFIERNRIVSGISDGVLIVEGGYRSGTAVTARIAKEQKKKIFCVPSSLENPKGLVPNKLINEGAILVRDEQDIIKSFSDNIIQKRKNIENEIKVDKDKLPIYYILVEEMDINELVKKSELNIEEVNYQLMILELNNKIEQLPGKRYRRKIYE